MSKRSRRGNGDGTVRERKRGGRTIGWEVVITYTDLETGLSRRKSLSAPTRPAALARRKEFEQELARMGGLPNQERTVGQVLMAWLDAKRVRVAKKSLEDYTRVVEKRLMPALGSVPLARLKPADVERMMRRLVEEQKPAEANRALSRLRMALRFAVDHGWVAANVAERCHPVSVAVQEHRIWQPDEALNFLRSIEGRREHAMYAVFLATGMRSGEVRGLKWQDVDLQGGTIHVRRQWLEAAKAAESDFAAPKRGSAREIRLGAELVTLLKQHQARLNEEREGLGELWNELDLVFPSITGTPILATNLHRQFKAAAKAAGVPEIRIHDLRDTAASTMLATGTPLPLVAKILGHKDTSITLKKYTHVLDRQREQHPVSHAIYHVVQEDQAK